jgi:riboflavin synthase
MLISNAADILSDCHLGDSISVNGTCLTVTTLPSASTFTVGIAPETLRRTNLGSLTTSSSVNLERAMLPSTRMGGHIVQGHVDTVATISSITPDGEALTFRFTPRDKDVLKYIVEKGFVAIDGASLTVTKVVDGSEGESGYWEVMLIEYTQSRIVTASKKVGEEVNVEVDMVGKYVEKSIGAWFTETGVVRGSTGPGGVLERLVSKMVDDRMKGVSNGNGAGNGAELSGRVKDALDEIC